VGTRAVVHVNLEPVNYGKDIWIATHWDGDPDSLGKDLKKSITEEIAERKKSPHVEKPSDVDMGSVLQTAVVKAVASHHIDLMSVEGKKDFDKQYGDWAEYEYEIDPKTGKIKFREREGEWKTAKIGKWKKLSEVI
jgi:hypothetical protein